jgi:hypothetical protein
MSLPLLVLLLPPAPSEPSLLLLSAPLLRLQSMLLHVLVPARSVPGVVGTLLQVPPLPPSVATALLLLLPLLLLPLSLTVRAAGSRPPRCPSAP